MDKTNFWTRIVEQAIRQSARAASVFDRIGFVWLFVLLSVLLLVPVVVLNPAKLGAYLWFMSKLGGAAALGYGCDLAFFRGSDPRFLNGIEQSMAQSRRGLLVVGAMIGAGLIG